MQNIDTFGVAVFPDLIVNVIDVMRGVDEFPHFQSFNALETASLQKLNLRFAQPRLSALVFRYSLAHQRHSFHLDLLSPSP